MVIYNHAASPTIVKGARPAPFADHRPSAIVMAPERSASPVKRPIFVHVNGFSDGNAGRTIAPC